MNAVEIRAMRLSEYISFIAKYVKRITIKDGMSSPKNRISVSESSPRMKNRDMISGNPGRRFPPSS